MYDLYVIVDTQRIDSYLGCYVIFPDTVQLPAPVEVDPQTKDHDEAGKPPQGQEPIEAGKAEQKQGNPKKCLCLHKHFERVSLILVPIICVIFCRLNTFTNPILFHFQLWPVFSCQRSTWRL